MEIEFDPAKNAANLAAHGLALAFGAAVFGDSGHLIVPSHRTEDGEDRWKAIGLVDGKFYTAVHVWRGEAIRFISVRRSSAGEQRLYHSASRRSE
ncbi:hypothetical protein IP88_05795 [alpha proteobacterium AAP81b]|nr:hypothetical protein IP88_05795 [alpha proteobacterium AAP81b]